MVSVRDPEALLVLLAFELELERPFRTLEALLVLGTESGLSSSLLLILSRSDTDLLSPAVSDVVE